MSLESVREFFRMKNLGILIIELEVSTATVATAGNNCRYHAAALLVSFQTLINWGLAS